MTHSGFTPLVTTRLQLRPPRDEDAPTIFKRYASVAAVVRYVG
jgi:hypothetical protein